MALVGSLAVTTSLAAGVGPSSAQDQKTAERQVVLRMRGGDLQVTGELKAFDGSRYVIESPQGRLTLQASRFDCQGPACTVLSTGTGWAAEQLSVDRPETIVLRGPDPVMQVMPALIRAYAASAGVQAVQLVGTTPNVHRWRLADTKGAELATIELHVATNQQALQGLAAGNATIAMTGRPAHEPEVEALSALGAGTTVVAAAGSPVAPPPKRSLQGHEHSVGSQGLAVIVSPDNPMSGITLDALARIFSGQVTDWYELGLPPGRIVLHGAPEGSDSLDRLREMVLQPRGLQAAAIAQRAASEAAAADAVARDRNGIALVSFPAVRSARSLNIESTCGLVHRPTVFSVKAEEYPLSQPLYLYAATPARQAAARALLSFATSRDAHGALADSLIAGSAVESVTLDGQAERMATALNAPADAFDLAQMRAMLADLKGSRRLSTTFRFVPGTLDLDARSRAEITQLAALLQTPEYAGRRVLFAGYTDAGGRFPANLTQSFKRAAQIRTAILAAAGTGRLTAGLLVAKGFGPLAPVACNGDAEGHRLNRRVEVWLRE